MRRHKITPTCHNRMRGPLLRAQPDRSKPLPMNGAGRRRGQVLSLPLRTTCAYAGICGARSDRWLAIPARHSLVKALPVNPGPSQTRVNRHRCRRSSAGRSAAVEVAHPVPRRRAASRLPAIVRRMPPAASPACLRRTTAAPRPSAPVCLWCPRPIKQGRSVTVPTPQPSAARPRKKHRWTGTMGPPLPPPRYIAPVPAIAPAPPRPAWQYRLRKRPRSLHRARVQPLREPMSLRWPARALRHRCRPRGGVPGK
jgi:hypothetical protein